MSEKEPSEGKNSSIGNSPESIGQSLARGLEIIVYDEDTLITTSISGDTP